MRCPLTQFWPTLSAKRCMLSGEPTHALLPKYFLKFQTKSHHIVKSIPSRLTNSRKLGGTGRDGSPSTCFAVQRSNLKYSESLMCKNPLSDARTPLSLASGSSALVRPSVSGASHSSRTIRLPMGFFRFALRSLRSSSTGVFFKNSATFARFAGTKSKAAESIFSPWLPRRRS